MYYPSYIQSLNSQLPRNTDTFIICQYNQNNFILFQFPYLFKPMLLKAAKIPQDIQSPSAVRSKHSQMLNGQREVNYQLHREIAKVKEVFEVLSQKRGGNLWSDYLEVSYLCQTMLRLFQMKKWLCLVQLNILVSQLFWQSLMQLNIHLCSTYDQKSFSLATSFLQIVHSITNSSPLCGCFKLKLHVSGPPHGDSLLRSYSEWHTVAINLPLVARLTEIGISQTEPLGYGAAELAFELYIVPTVFPRIFNLLASNDWLCLCCPSDSLHLSQFPIFTSCLHLFNQLSHCGPPMELSTDIN